MAVVEINGADAGVSLLPPHRFDLTQHVRCGMNQIRISVTNSRANEFTDAKLPSGLLGPVTVQIKSREK